MRYFTTCFFERFLEIPYYENEKTTPAGLKLIATLIQLRINSPRKEIVNQLKVKYLSVFILAQSPTIRHEGTGLVVKTLHLWTIYKSCIRTINQNTKKPDTEKKKSATTLKGLLNIFRYLISNRSHNLNNTIAIAIDAFRDCVQSLNNWDYLLILLNSIVKKTQRQRRSRIVTYHCWF
jgi:hypothetical protein